MRKETEEDVITRIAWLYYKEKMTQQEIAERISLSRQKVQRLLEKARDLEIIQFTLKHPYVNLMSIESEIREKFGLKDAVVAPMASDDPERLQAGLCHGGGRLPGAQARRDEEVHPRASGGATRPRTWRITSSRS